VLNGLSDILFGNEELVDEFMAEFKRELTRVCTENLDPDVVVMKSAEDRV
jgi:hypothetical protein